MKIQLASDLHLEFLERDFPGERLIAPAYGVDVLVLAGDKLAMGRAKAEKLAPAEWLSRREAVIKQQLQADSISVR